MIEAGKERLRPLLMTTLAMILGMLPIALAGGPGSEVKNGDGLGDYWRPDQLDDPDLVCSTIYVPDFR